MNKLNQKYQLWSYADSGYHLTEFDNLNELPGLISNAYTQDFYITQKLVINITEGETK